MLDYYRTNKKFPSSLNLKEISIIDDEILKKRPKRPIFVPIRIEGKKRCRSCHIQNEKICKNKECFKCENITQCNWIEGNILHILLIIKVIKNNLKRLKNNIKMIF